MFKPQLDVAEAQIVQNSPHSLDVLIVPRATFSESSERSVLREIRSRLGHQIDVRIKRVTSIAREPNGKFRAVKSSVSSSARWGGGATAPWTARSAS